ncbi:MAG: alpha/beta fold hydrolase [Thermoplasmataceae archaeon]
MRRNIIKTRHGEMSFLEGEGEIPVILLHGLGGMGNVFFKLSNCLSRRYKFIFPDLLGHGHTVADDDNITLRMQCESVEDLIKGLNLKKPIIGGHSYGGWIALNYATMHDDISALLLISNAGTNPTLSDRGDAAIEKFLDLVVEVNRKNDRSTMKKIIINNSKDEMRVPESSIKRLRVPTLIVWGSEDHMIPLEYGINLSRLIPGSRLYIIEGGGHKTHYSHYEEVCKAIGEFLSTLNRFERKTVDPQ